MSKRTIKGKLEVIKTVFTPAPIKILSSGEVIAEKVKGNMCRCYNITHTPYTKIPKKDLRYINREVNKLVKAIGKKPNYEELRKNTEFFHYVNKHRWLREYRKLVRLTKHGKVK